MSNPNDDLRKKIEAGINSASAETGSDTPDFILAEYLTDCLEAYDKAVMAREKWYGRPAFPSANTAKSVSPTSSANEQADHETAEEKVAWLTEILVIKAGDPAFTDYWLRLARRNLRLGLPLTTPEPELNPSTEESSATDHFRDATKMVSGDSSAAVKQSLTAQPQPIASAPEYTRILVYCQRVAVNTGWWQIAEYDEETGEWLDDVVDGEFLLVKPTLWLPLPPAPTQPQ